MAGLFIGTLAYELSQVRKLQEINREVSLFTLEAGRISVRLLQGFDAVAEFAAKSALLGDPDYRTQWIEWETAVNADLGRLAVVTLSEPEAEILRQMMMGWNRYESLTPDLLGGSAGNLPEVEAILAALRSDTEALISANESVVAERAQASAQAAGEARSVARLAAAGSLALAALLSLLLYLSIAAPLRRFTRGTRELAQGHFAYRLDVQQVPGEFRELARDLDRMAERLGELDVMKEEFISHVSHELKAPLAAIHETIEIFLDGIPGPLSAKQRHLMELSRKNSQRLASMISDLLTISRLEVGADGYEPGWHDFAEIVEATVEELGPLANERKLWISVQLPPGGADLACDPRRIADVVGNLVGNAAKFSPVGGAVGVQLAKLERLPDGMDAPQTGDGTMGEPPFFLLSVEDEGPGVADEHKEAIFEKFNQVNGRERLRGQGVGLGLAIARRITQAHGGRIWVEDSEAGGSVFRVLIPRFAHGWSNRVSPEPPVRTPETDPADEGPPAPASPRTGALLGAFAMVILSGCASLPFFGGESPAEPASESPAAGEVEPLSGAAEERIAAGWSFLESRSFDEAFQEFSEAIAIEPDRGLQAEAHWGRALVHLLSDGPLGDRERAGASLTTLEEEFPDTRHGMQALWVLTLLRELEQVRNVVADQEAILRQLTETVEMLKAIDLNRRPPARRPPPG